MPPSQHSTSTLYDLHINLHHCSIKQLRVPKWIGRHLPVGTRTARWSHTNTSQCPRCGIPNEDHIHVLTCQHPGATARVTNWLDNLELWLVKQHTLPSLRCGILSLLKASFRGTIWRPPTSADPAVQNTFRRQQQQGQKTVMFGWWDTGWAETQQAYLLSLSRRTTGKRWLSRLIKKQWEIYWDLWRHRIEVAVTPDSFSVASAHEQLNQDIHIVDRNY